MGIAHQPHGLKGQKTGEQPKHWIFFDCETTVGKPVDGVSQHTFRLGWCVYWRPAHDKHVEHTEWLFFRDAAAFWQFVDAHSYRRSKTVVVAHNLVYDFMVADGFRQLATLGYETRDLIYGPGVQCYSFTRDKRVIECLDSLNYFKSSLEQLGKDVGEYKLHVNPLTATDDELIPYCKQDVQVLLTAFRGYLTFLREHDLGPFAITRAGQAFNAYRHRFMRHNIYIHTMPETIALEREAYYGGRVQCNYIGRAPTAIYYHVDINSMYPYVMKDNPYPTNAFGPVRRMLLSHLSHVLERYLVVAECDINTDVPLYPLRHNNLLIFPTGRFTTSLCTPEIRVALMRGHLLGVRRVNLYDHKPIFTEFITTLYALRQRYKASGNETYQMFCKLFLNSLYGKFGQRLPEWQTIGECALDDVDYRDVYRMNGEHWQERSFGGVVQRKQPGGNAMNAFVAISAHVTSYARVYLYSLCEYAGWENVYYTDTDCMIVNQRGFDRLAEFRDDKRLGYLKLERVGDYLDIRAPKDYTLNDTIVHKGIPKRAEQPEPWTWNVELWPSLAGLARAGVLGGYYTEHITKQPTYEYNRGIIGSDGWTAPFHLSE